MYPLVIDSEDKKYRQYDLSKRISSPWKPYSDGTIIHEINEGFDINTDVSCLKDIEDKLSYIFAHTLVFIETVDPLTGRFGDLFPEYII